MRYLKIVLAVAMLVMSASPVYANTFTTPAERVVEKYTMPFTDHCTNYVLVKKRHHDWVTLHEGESSWLVPLPWSNWTVRYRVVGPAC